MVRRVKGKKKNSTDPRTNAEQKRDYLAQTDKGPIGIIETFLGRDSLKLAATSKHNYAMFSPSLDALLEAVVQGNQNKVERLPNTKVLLHKADVVDYSGRHFKKVTAYQYALWSLDIRMVRAIEDKVHGVPGKAGNELQAALIAQRKELKERGLNYIFHGELFNETQYNPKSLFKAYEELHKHTKELEKQMEARPGEGAEAFHAPMLGVFYELSLQQRLMPAHMIQEICAPNRPLIPLPQLFYEKLLFRKAQISGSGGKIGMTPVFPIKEKLSFSKEEFILNAGDSEIKNLFFIARGESENAVDGEIALSVLMMGWAIGELKALQTLCELRVNQLEKEPDFSGPEAEFKSQP